LLVATTACPRPHSVEDANLDSGAATDGDARADGLAEDYRWPHDPENPVLRLDIEMADGGGAIEIELMPQLAPKNVEQLVSLVGDGYYDGTTFHRVIRGFMIQGGDPNTRDLDPNNDGQGGRRLPLPDEVSSAPFQRGVVALANHGRSDSNSSQFFIVQTENRALDGQYTAVGRVVSGIELVDEIADTPTDGVGRWGPKDRPIESVVIRRASTSRQRSASAPPSHLPEARSASASPSSLLAPDQTP
jgi:peptidyl-prolyl cis-trans isomerase B (cyclophilin B)